MPTEAETSALIEAVRTIARAEILPRFRNLDPTEVAAKSDPGDLVTVADRAAEAAIAEAAGRILPDAAVVGEEGVAEDPSRLEAIARSARCLIVDPIDGTANFVAGLATFGVILALVEEGRTSFGLLYDPVADDWVTAVAGQGAHYARAETEPRPLAVADAAPDEAQGFLSARIYAPGDRGALHDAFAGFRYARSIGCSCHDYRTMAFGQAQFIASPMMNPWDHAAGVLVVEEAGGVARVGGHAGYAPHMTRGPIAVASSPAILAAVEAAQAAAPVSGVD